MADSTITEVIQSLQNSSSDTSCAGVQEWREGDKFVRRPNVFEEARAARTWQAVQEEADRQSLGNGSVAITFVP